MSVLAYIRRDGKMQRVCFRRGSRTLHLDASEVRYLKQWLRSNAKGYYVKERPTVRSRKTGIHSIIVYFDDNDDVWNHFSKVWL